MKIFDSMQTDVTKTPASRREKATLAISMIKDIY